MKNIQKTTINFDGILRSFDYEYKCEYNDYSPSGYFTRLQRAFPDEIIKGGSGFNGVYGARASLKTIKGDEINVEDNSPLSDCVASLSFKNDNAILSYPFSSLNKERKAESTIDKTYTYNKWNYQFRTKKTVYGWIKPTSNPTDEQRIYGLSTDDILGFRFKLFVNKDKTISFVDLSSDIGNSNNFKLSSSNKLEIGKWNLIGFKIDYKIANSTKEITLVLNDEIKTETYKDELSMDALSYFVIGEASQSFIESSNAGSVTSNVTNSKINMPFRMAFTSVGSADITLKEFESIYKEGKKILI